MSANSRRPRRYTTEGGWSRKPTPVERARDGAVDLALDAAIALSRLVIRPNLTFEERVEKRREAEKNGQWNVRIPHHTPWYMRVRKGRVAATLAGLAAAHMLYPSLVTDAAQPVNGSVVVTQPPRPQPTVIKEMPAFTDEQKTQLWNAYDAIKTHWQANGYPEAPTMVLVSGNGAAFACYSETDIVTPEDSSTYCPPKNTILITPANHDDWEGHMGGEEAIYSVVGHEYGHFLQDMDNGDSDEYPRVNPPLERSATCYEGQAIQALRPDFVVTIYEATRDHGQEDFYHGDPGRLANAFLAGAQGEPCALVYFLPQPTPTATPSA